MTAAAERVFLLDVNVLIALFDPGHLHHEAAHGWFASVEDRPWATCPLTQNGFVRILANPAYAGRRTTVADAADRLQRFTEASSHRFWEDDVSLLDPTRLVAAKLTGHREITDAYLLALAVGRGGALATFDTNVRGAAVVGAEERHLEVLRA
ncbi:MAG TPA: TA system VapC family ribonuclease toxin [Longimicrobiales bacterium]|nr:TA system VapC family ribonuclease toxin [Longimicrobiales bacterium]